MPTLGTDRFEQTFSDRSENLSKPSILPDTSEKVTVLCIISYIGNQKLLTSCVLAWANLIV